MPSLNFSAPNLATVAYAEVAANGTSTRINSGVGTTRSSVGLYFVILPTSLGQFEYSDIVLVQPLGSDGDGTNVSKSYDIVRSAPLSFSDDIDPFTVQVQVWDAHPHYNTTPIPAATLIDSAFHIVILRTTIKPPAGAPG
jgi:hypothetical protein